MVTQPRAFALLASILSLVAVVVPSRAAAQEPSLEVVEVDHTSHPTVRVVVSAPRELVGLELPPSAFEVREDGVLRASAVERLPSEALEVVLVVDTSGSMGGGGLDAAKQAALGFVEQMPPGTRVGMVAFGGTASVATPFTSDPAALRAAVDGLSAGGETALFDAVGATAELLGSASGARRAVVLLSDGGDTVSTTSPQAAAASLGAIEAEFFAVALGSSEAAADTLASLATAGGGRVVPAGDPAQLQSVYDTIASRLVNRYELRYRSEADGPVVVEVAVAHGGVTAAGTVESEFPSLPPVAEPPIATPTEALPTIAVSPGLFERGWTLVLGAGAFLVALTTLAWIAMGKREPRRRLAREVDLHPSDREGRLAEVSHRAGDLAERFLERHRRAGPLNRSLERAGLAMRPGEFVVLGAASSVLAGTIGLMLAGLVGGVVLAGFAAGGFAAALRVFERRRREAFASQLGDTLDLLASTLRTGYGLTQAIDSISREAEAPTSDELRRVVVETRLGRDLGDALADMADRVGSEDFDWVVQAIDIHREVGGDLADLLDQVGETIRDRDRIRRQVKVLSSEGRITAWILLVLPFAVVGLFQFTNPGYFAELTDRGAGQVMIGAGLVLMAVGSLWLRKLIHIRF